MRAARWLALVVAAAGCSGGAAIGFHTSAFVANMTVESVEVRVYRAAAGPLDCAQVAAAPATALAAGFPPETCARLAPGRVLPVDRNWTTIRNQVDGGAADPACDAVIIRAPDLPDTLLFWQQPGYVDVRDPITTTLVEALDPHGIYLERAGDRIFAAGSSLITSLPSTATLADTACSALPNVRDAGAQDAGGGQ